eukprot:2707445-Pyramimonas_sp.AAC.1
MATTGRQGQATPGARNARAAPNLTPGTSQISNGKARVALSRLQHGPSHVSPRGRGPRALGWSSAPRPRYTGSRGAVAR